MSTPAPVQPVDAGDANFQQVVIDASHEVPVLVDFWAPWCEPCKVIGPVLEKLAAEYQGKFKLVKVNMDENPMLAQALMIQSIPAVKLIADGAIKDEFMGASPEPEIRNFLEKNLAPLAAPEDDASAGLGLLAMGDRAGALRIFQANLADKPNDAVALIGMGTLALEEGNLEQAKQALEAVVEDDLGNLSDKTVPLRFLAALRSRLFLIEQAETRNSEGEPPEAEGDIEARFTGACGNALEGGFEEALESLLKIVREDRKFRDDGGRKAMLAVFDLLPPDSELGNSFRSQLSSLLFS